MSKATNTLITENLFTNNIFIFHIGVKILNQQRKRSYYQKSYSHLQINEVFLKDSF